MDHAYSFENCSYFFLPMLVKDEFRLSSYLKKGGGWREETECSVLKTSHILQYAS